MDVRGEQITGVDEKRKKRKKRKRRKRKRKHHPQEV